MGFHTEQGLPGLLTLAEALRQVEHEAAATNEPPSLDDVLEVALMEALSPAVRETWRAIDDASSNPNLDPSHKLAELVTPDCDRDACDHWCPQALGHALVVASREGHVRCVRRLREMMLERWSGSLMVALFNAFGLLKGAEAGHAAVVGEVLKPLGSAGAALMGFMVATQWKEKEGAGKYPFVATPAKPPARDWTGKLWATKATLPPAVARFQVGWEVRGASPALHETLHEVVRASYTTYLLWRVAVVAASKCHVEVLRVLLRRRWMENLFLKETLSVFFESVLPSESGESRWNGQVKRMVTDRAKMDTVMYQLVEEYSTKNYHDAMLYTLWKSCVEKQMTKLDVGEPKCVAEAHDGMWEIKLEVPLLMMPVEHAATNEEPKDRYKHLTMLYSQTAQLGIQLQTAVHGHTDFVQVSVAIKHVRFKAENSRWDDSCMGHFPAGVMVSVLPLTDDGSSVTLTNSSSNAEYTIGRGENITFGTSATTAGAKGFGAGISAGAGTGTSILMKSKPWRFEQVPFPDDDRGGSFKWTLQAMKGVPFDRANPIRMAADSSLWKWGRRVCTNPLDELPFTSEGGVQFTDSQFPDSMLWRFPRTREGTKLRWRINGEVHLTYTTSRYFETRSAKFSGDIEEEVKAAKASFETSIKEFKDDVEEILGLAPKPTTSSSNAPQKKNPAADDENDAKETAPTLAKFNTSERKQFVQWLEFKKALEEMQGSPKMEQDQIEEMQMQGSPEMDKDEIEAVIAEEEAAEETRMASPVEEDDQVVSSRARRSRLSRLSANKRAVT